MVFHWFLNLLEVLNFFIFLDPFLRFISVCLFLFLVSVVVSVRVCDFVHDLLVLCAFCSQTTPPPPSKKNNYIYIYI